MIMLFCNNNLKKLDESFYLYTSMPFKIYVIDRIRDNEIIM